MSWSLAGGRGAAVGVIVAVALAGCSVGPPPDPRATPVVAMASPSAAVAVAAAEVNAALGSTGLRLEQSGVEYRPGEPVALQFVPRAVYRASLPSPDEGWVLIYDLGTADAAEAAGQAFANYLGSGVGQTNYPGDAQFALSRAGTALVFSWWSPSRTADAEAAEIVLEAVLSVGETIEVRR